MQVQERKHYRPTFVHYIWIGIGAWEPWSQWDMTVLSIGKYSEWDNRLQNKWEFKKAVNFYWRTDTNLTNESQLTNDNVCAILTII